MAPARPLREIFQELPSEGTEHGATDPGELLRANGHPDLPDGLVAEAVVNYADTAPIEVAEHLSPYVMANSPVAVPDADADAPGWLEALASAPVLSADPVALDEPIEPAAHHAAAPDAPAWPGHDLDAAFGHGGHVPADGGTAEALGSDEPPASHHTPAPAHDEAPYPDLLDDAPGRLPEPDADDDGDGNDGLDDLA